MTGQYPTEEQYVKALLDAARRYISCGYKILLIHAKDTDYGTEIAKAKSPAGGFGPTSPTNDIVRFENALKSRMAYSDDITAFNFGVGISTNDTFVLDDDHRGESIAKLVETGRLDIAGCPIADTPRGRHVFFAGVEDITSGRIAGHNSLDYKANPGYVVAAPTLTENGRYQWVEDLIPKGELPEFPPTVADKLRQSKTKPADTKTGDTYEGTPMDFVEAVTRIEQRIASFGGIVARGERDNRCYDLVNIFFDYGATPDQALELMQRYVFPKIEQHQDDPFTMADLEHVVASGAAYRQRDIGAETVAAKFEKIAEQHQKMQSRIRDMNVARRDPPPNWVVQDLIAEGTPSAIIAASGDHKTNVMISLGYHIAMGRDFGPYRIDRPRKVLYCDLEGGFGFTDRVNHFVRHMGDNTPDGAWYHDPGPVRLSDPENAKVMIEIIRGLSIEVLVIDTFARSTAGSAENEAKDMSLVIAHIDLIRAETNCAVIMLAHQPKNSKDATIRGSGALDAAMHGRFSVEVLSRNPIKVRFYANHVKDAISHRAVLLSNKGGPNVVLLPEDTFSAADDTLSAELLRELLDAMDGSGKLKTPDGIKIIMEHRGVEKRRAQELLKTVDNLEFSGGVFTRAGQTLRWTPSAPESVFD